MTIIEPSTKTVRINAAKPGTVFKYEDSYYMVIKWRNCENLTGMVSLISGEIYPIEDKMKAELVDAELHIM